MVQLSTWVYCTQLDQWTTRNSQTAKYVSIEILQFSILVHLDTIQLFGSWFRCSGSGSLQPSQQEELALTQVGQKASCWAYEIVQSQISGTSTWVDPFSPHKIVQSVRRLFGMLVIQLRNSCKSPKCSFKLQQTQVVQERANCRLTLRVLSFTTSTFTESFSCCSPY